MKKKSLIFLCVITALYGMAQERLGITNSNYSSTNSIFLNPSSSVDSRTYMQFNIVGANAFAMTNLGYIPHFSVWQAQKSGIDNMKPSDLKLRRFMYANGSLEGPAFVISTETFGAGFFVRARSVAGLQNVPYRLANSVFKRGDPDKSSDNINYRNMGFGNMSWVEYGLNFGMFVKQQRNELITVGGSLRYLTGLNIAYGNISQLKGYYNDSIVEVDRLKGNIRYNKAGWNTGKGFGLDLGFTYKKMLNVVDGYFSNSPKSNCKYVDYKYKLAGSLRDLGYIRFGKNATKVSADGSGYFNTALSDTTYQQALEVHFNPTTVHTPIMASLPLSLSGQFDYNFENDLYFNITVVKNLVPRQVTGVQSSDLVSFCPRYEFRQFEVAMPLTFQRYLYPQLGFAFRVRSFVLGFDNVFPLIIKKNTYGVNVYFSLGFSLFKHPGCKAKSIKVDYCPPKRKIPKRKKGPGPKHRKSSGDDVF